MTTYQEISAQFYSNRLLFGNPADAGVVAVEVASKTEIDVYKRLSGELTRERRPLRLFALVENRELLEGFKAPHETRVLDGDFRYRVLVTFSSTDALEAARRHLRSVTDKAPNATPATIAMAKEFKWLGAYRPAGFAWMTQDLNPTGAIGDATQATTSKGEAALKQGAQNFVELLREVDRFDLARLREGPLG